MEDFTVEDVIGEGQEWVVFEKCISNGTLVLREVAQVQATGPAQAILTVAEDKGLGGKRYVALDTETCRGKLVSLRYMATLED